MHESCSEHVPLLTEYTKNRDGSLTGLIFGKSETADGSELTTSRSLDSHSVDGVVHITTETGTVYRLGEPKHSTLQRPRESRRASRREGADGSGGGPLRLLGEQTVEGPMREAAALLGEHELTFECGGTEAGGSDATRLLSRSFHELDGDLLALRGQYRASDRVALLRRGRVVSAAVVHVHAEHGILDIPIFATAKDCRGHGFGGVLVALLRGLSRHLGIRSLVASATDESRAFWCKQGLHIASFCAPGERSALRGLNRAGLCRGFQNSLYMAAPVAVQSGFCELSSALARSGAGRVRGLNARAASAALGYEDVHTRGNYWLRADGTRQHIEYLEEQESARTQA